MSERGGGQRRRKECLEERRVAVHAMGSAGGRIYRALCLPFPISFFFRVVVAVLFF